MKKIYFYFMFLQASIIQSACPSKKTPSAVDRRYEITAATFQNPNCKIVSLDKAGTRAHLRIYNPEISRHHFLHCFFVWDKAWKPVAIIPQTVFPDAAADATTQALLDKLKLSGRW
jgi:hypothetical protein